MLLIEKWNEYRKEREEESFSPAYGFRSMISVSLNKILRTVSGNFLIERFAELEMNRRYMRKEFPSEPKCYAEKILFAF